MEKSKCMEKNVLNLLYVISACTHLVAAKEGEDCVSINVPVKLYDTDGKLKQFISHSVCKESEEVDANIKIRQLCNLSKEDFVRLNPYCHISTYPVNDAGGFMVSFDENDDEPCKVEFGDGYEYLDIFFNKFNKMRNDLIDKKEIVKDDDIFQYLDIVISKMKANRRKEIFQKIKKRFLKID